ncbi:hypothetical protein EVAR_88584_1 [Eumeta japonica]|uniref:Uncharacterized protein n=1 Tax=Eumeta variegata TaxID=151549 RepID=A0A4C1Y6A4_EUMVA|nr:hypothetical protein EVAR_88584_1 [Eumeta japonica]
MTRQPENLRVAPLSEFVWFRFRLRRTKFKSSDFDVDSNSGSGSDSNEPNLKPPTRTSVPLGQNKLKLVRQVFIKSKQMAPLALHGRLKYWHGTFSENLVATAELNFGVLRNKFTKTPEFTQITALVSRTLRYSFYFRRRCSVSKPSNTTRRGLGAAGDPHRRLDDDARNRPT